MMLDCFWMQRLDRDPFLVWHFLDVCRFGRHTPLIYTTLWGLIARMISLLNEKSQFH